MRSTKKRVAETTARKGNAPAPACGGVRDAHGCRMCVCGMGRNEGWSGRGFCLSGPPSTPKTANGAINLARLPASFSRGDHPGQNWRGAQTPWTRRSGVVHPSKNHAHALHTVFFLQVWAPVARRPAGQVPYARQAFAAGRVYHARARLPQPVSEGPRPTPTITENRPKAKPLMCTELDLGGESRPGGPPCARRAGEYLWDLECRPAKGAPLQRKKKQPV